MSEFNKTQMYTDGHMTAVHPGTHIRDFIEVGLYSQKELAIRMCISEKKLSELINGKCELNPELQVKIAIATGTKVSQWKRLNDGFHRDLAEIRLKQQLKKEKQMLREVNYQYWVEQGIMEETDDDREKVLNLRRYLEINSLQLLKSRYFLVQYKATGDINDEKHILNSNAWVQTAVNVGKKIQTEDINLKGLREVIPEVKELTNENIEKSLPKLKELFAKNGIEFVILPPLKDSGIHGAVKWVNDRIVLLALADDFTYEDEFWMVLLHEIKHVLQAKKGHIIVASDDKDIDSVLDLAKLEKEADDYANKVLMSKAKYNRFVEQKDFSKVAVIKFADQIEIKPGLVVNRLQRNGLIGKDELNDLRIKYVRN
ncbi:hypothetical protein ACQW5G_01735 [Fructilactobacillus sp. Tb1]|uniref:hypothetical protein n=1 Tax=Fructilactobacillus sp. Tb1 TaxID=3422304 RepID=UPI003D29AF3D